MTNPEAEPISAEGLAELRRQCDREEFYVSGPVAHVGEAAARIVRPLIALIDAQAAEIATLRAREAEFVRFEVGEMRHG